MNVLKSLATYSKKSTRSLVKYSQSLFGSRLGRNITRAGMVMGGAAAVAAGVAAAKAGDTSLAGGLITGGLNLSIGSAVGSFTVGKKRFPLSVASTLGLSAAAGWFGSLASTAMPYSDLLMAGTWGTSSATLGNLVSNGSGFKDSPPQR